MLVQYDLYWDLTILRILNDIARWGSSSTVPNINHDLNPTADISHYLHCRCHHYRCCYWKRSSSIYYAHAHVPHLQPSISILRKKNTLPAQRALRRNDEPPSFFFAIPNNFVPKAPVARPPAAPMSMPFLSFLGLPSFSMTGPPGGIDWPPYCAGSGCSVCTLPVACSW